MKKMTSDQIRLRLTEIKAEQAAHEARDFDAELLKLMQDGGNVDALEDQQLDAERAARRLRVEAQALKAMLPDAVRAEVRTAIEDLVRDGQPDREALKECIAELVALDQRRLEIYGAIGTITDRQEAALKKARELTGLGRVNAHGEAYGEEPIISTALAQELVALLAANTIDFQALPEHTTGQLFQHLSIRQTERERSQRIEQMQEIHSQRAAAF